MCSRLNSKKKYKKQPEDEETETEFRIHLQQLVLNPQNIDFKMAEDTVMHGLDWLFAIGVLFFLLSAWGIGMFSS